MLSKQTVKDYLNRKLDNFEWVKELSSTQIDSVLSEFMPKHLYEYLWIHQKMMLSIMYYQPRFLLFSGMGSGKTRTILTQLRNRKIQGEKPKAIVFVPYLTAVDTWVNEIENFAPELTCCPLLESSARNIELLRTSNADVFPVCYQSAVFMFTRKVFDAKKQKNKMIVDPNAVNDLITDFDTLILDEVHRCQSHDSQTFLLCSLISSKVEWVYGLTGTPFGRDKQSLWSEFYLVDFGETLGDTISFYRSIFFTKKTGFWGGMEFKFKKRLTGKLQKMIRNKSIHFSTNEMVDIPDKQYIPIKLSMHDSIRAYVEKALKELQAAVIDKDYDLAGNSFLTLRQAASGFITTRDDEGGKDRLKARLDHNPKLEALQGLVEAMEDDAKMVVFHDYIYSGEMIHEQLTKMKIGHSRIWSGQKDPLGELNKFRKDDNCKVLVINSKSGSSALNLQNASIIVFYECPSVIDRAQAEARCWRPGQTKKVLIYDLLVRDTLDVDYYKTIRAGGDLLKDFLSNKKAVLS